MTSVSDTLAQGMIGEVTKTVTAAMTAPVAGSGTVDVFATPMMVALMEGAAVACVEHLLPEAYTTLGTHIDAAHLSPTPPGLSVTARAQLTGIEGRKLTFAIEARDELEIIGRATHTRVIVDRPRFAARLAAKLEAVAKARSAG